MLLTRLLFLILLHNFLLVVVNLIVEVEVFGPLTLAGFAVLYSKLGAPPSRLIRSVVYPITVSIIGCGAPRRSAAVA